MLAETMMVKDLVTTHEDALITDAFAKMREAKLRMLPVLDAKKRIIGVLSTFCVIGHIVPDYLISGDLNQISYAPDVGILRKNYKRIANQTVGEVMNKDPLLVRSSESLLSVAAALYSSGRHEYAWVINDENELVGVLSAGDILDTLKLHASEVNNA